MTALTPVVAAFAVYLALMLAIGVAAWWRARTYDDFVLGGRRMNPLITALAAGASDMSGWLLLGLPGALYAAGAKDGWIALGLIAGAYANWRFVAARLRVYTERAGNALTLPAYFRNRFADDGRALSTLSALVILVFFAIYAASGIVAGARLFESLFAVSYPTAMLLGAAVTILYTTLGGFLAVSWTDATQATLMVFALIAAPIMVLLAAGGPADAIATIAAVDPALADPLDGLTAIGLISMLGWGLGYAGQPHIVNRFMAAESARAIAPARRIAMGWMVICLVGAMACGYFAIAAFADNAAIRDALAANPERVFILLSRELFPPWIAGVLLAAVLAAIMSTLSSQLLVSSSALANDFYRAWLKPGASERELLWVSRLALLAVAIVALALAWNPESRVLDLVAYAWAGFGAAFGPLVVLSLYWRGMTRRGALAGIVTGAVTVMVWKNANWFELYELVPAFALATVAIVITSKLDRAPAVAVTALFDRVDAEARRL